MSVWSLFLVFNTILFFLIITPIRIYYINIMYHTILLIFQYTWGYEIFHPLIYLNLTPYALQFHNLQNAGPDIERNTSKKQKRMSASQPSSMQSNHPSRTTWSDFAMLTSLKLRGLPWKHYQTPNRMSPPPPLPSSKASPGEKPSHNDGFQ